MDSEALAAFLATGQTRLPLRYTQLINPAIEGFKCLLAEPESYRAAWCCDAWVQGDPDDGLIHRSGGEYDFKYFFHYRPRLRRLLAAKGVDFSRHEDWLDILDEMYQAVQAAAISAGRAVDSAFPGMDNARLLSESGETVLRLLWYEEVNYDAFIAQPHTDRCWATIHLADNVPGLRIGEQVIETQEDDALFFASQKLDILSAGRIPAVEHEAVLVDGASRDEKRWVAVAFLNTDTPNEAISAGLVLPAFARPGKVLSSWDIACSIADKHPLFTFPTMGSYHRALDLLCHRRAYLAEAGRREHQRFFRITDKGFQRMRTHPGEFRGIFRN